MSRAVAIGDGRRLTGYALAGAEVHHAASAADAEAAWEALDAEAMLVVLTPEAHAALATRLSERELLWVVLPS